LIPQASHDLPVGEHETVDRRMLAFLDHDDTVATAGVGTAGRLNQ
jgi:hypothetical protein